MAFPRMVVLGGGSVDRARHLCRPLVGRSGGVPVVAVAEGWQDGGFRLAERTPDRAAAETLLESALAHTSAQVWSWTVAEESGFLWWKRPRVLRGVGAPEAGPGEDDLSTALLLLPDALADAAARLGAGALLLSAPRRGRLLAAAGELSDVEAVRRLAGVGADLAARAGQDAVSGDHVFGWKDGGLCGWHRVEAAAGAIARERPDDTAWWG